MNNILSFNEYNGQELETIVYDQVLNEKKMLRGFFNKRAARKVREELAEEIEMSKTIMEGIKEGLESLNENFDEIKNSLEKDDSDKKGEKQKLLDSIMEILEKSRKNTWDINELIDEGEIDYAGFTANVGIAAVAYFGILFAPIRAAVLMHKGYNYFFNIVKNTIRKSLVMLQLNFDQFENLIITKGFQSDDYQRELDTAQEIEGYFKDIETELVGKGGIVSGKKIQEYTKKLQAAKVRADEKRKSNKAIQSSGNFYNCLDQYNNTYTRSLETLRQYTQDDVQKQLDSIKNSMNKLAGQEVDLQTFSELIIAAAEEHAYKVSSSIYNKFAKMTEVFSLPNQKKLIDLINESTAEQMEAARKASEDVNKEKLEKARDKREEEGVGLFNKLGGKVGSLDKETNKYDDIDVSKLSFDDFEKMEDSDKDIFDSWLSTHSEILKKCDKRFQVSINIPESELFQDYCDSLIDYIGENITEKVSETYILNFDEYHLLESEKKKDDDLDWDDYVRENEYEALLKKVRKFRTNKVELEKAIDAVIAKSSKKEWANVLSQLKDYLKELNEKSKDDVKKSYIDFNDLNDHQLRRIKELYIDNKDVAVIAFKSIGKFIKDSTFVENSEDIVNVIISCHKSKKEKLNKATNTILSRVVKELKDKRSHDYYDPEEESKKSGK